jgi:phospholipase C
MAASFKHLVVLMMENRSFDHILGFLPRVNGLTGNETNPLTPEGPRVQVSQDARTVHDLIPDPGHEFINVNMQIFGNQAGTDDGQPKMQGFVRDYALVSNDSVQGANIMKCFTTTTVPVLSALAQAYAVSDSWYSSVPGSTIPHPLPTSRSSGYRRSREQESYLGRCSAHRIGQSQSQIEVNPYAVRR